jgi:hypothetical protein
VEFFACAKSINNDQEKFPRARKALEGIDLDGVWDIIENDAEPRGVEAR